MPNPPDPLVPVDVDLRDFAYMPVDIVRLFGSEFHAVSDDTAWRAGVTLWLKSWHQLPAGSLPSSDRELSVLAELCLRKWRRVRASALRGWIACADGRLYHSEVADRVSAAWRGRQRLLARIDRRLQILSQEWADIRLAVFKRDGFVCRYCGATGRPLECDHVVPVSKGGPTTMGNLATACRPCNRSKRDKLLADWRPI